MLTSHSLRVQGPAMPMVMGQPALEPVRLSGREGINSLFEYELFLKTPDALNFGASLAADFDLDAFIGREVSCTIELDGSGLFVAGSVGAAADRIGAGVREINALVTSAQFWGEEGRRIQYKLTLRPWLHLATLTSDCKVFQNRTVVEILDELLADYPFAVDKRLYERYPQRDYQVQYNESDFAFLERLCQEWGISYHFEHSEGKHRLVLSDAMSAFRANASAAYQQVEYHPPGWRVDAEFIHAFAPEHHLTSGRYSTTEYDYTQPRADLRIWHSDARPTGQAEGEVYQWHGGEGASHYAQPRAGSPAAGTAQGVGNAFSNTRDEGRLIALLRMAQLRNAGARAKASGNLRGMQPGHTFKLARHPRQKANAEYLILDTQLLIEDTGQDSQVKGAAGVGSTGVGSVGRGQQWRVQVDFTAHPVREQLRPAHTRTKPHTHGPQTALVVGPEDQNLWTDEFGRIKVQFPWDRIGGKNQHSSCWVRVSSPWAGNQLGGVHIPRIGQEVVVDFIGGDPDLPICTGRVANQVNLPPWKLPEQSALSGFRSRELTDGHGNSAAGRSNHLVMDDTAGQIQTQLKSDHQHSSLSLGHITRIEDREGRKDARGQGAELRTDGHMAIRAAAGMVISTEGRPNAEGHVTSMDEALARLDAAQVQHKNLADSALQANAHDVGDQDEVAQSLLQQHHDIKGEGSADPAKGQFPELQAPHVVLSSPEGIETTSARSTHIHAGEHVALSSQSHTSIATGKSLLVSATQAVRLFAYNTGMRFMAWGGDIQIQALKNSIQVLANLEIQMTAQRIKISATKEVVLNGGGSTITLNAAGIREATTGKHLVFAASHPRFGPDNAPVQAAEEGTSLEQGEQAVSVQLRSHAEDGRLITLEPYTLYRGKTVIQRGVTDSQGRIQIEDHKPGTLLYRVELAHGEIFDLPVAAQHKSDDDRIAAQGYRAVKNEKKDRRQNHATRDQSGTA